MKTALATLLLALAAVTLLAACESDEVPPVTDSGIEGQALIGPQCPVVVEGTPCPDEPFQAIIDVWNAERTERVATFESGEEGRFRLALPPGDYYLDPQPPSAGGPPTGEPQEVTVPPGRFLEVTISYDSGIR
ncbi:MAG: hypothetical protein WD379_07520 [Dehalococcoidia bacterium]